jgi:hypothetical protein
MVFHPTGEISIEQDNVAITDPTFAKNAPPGLLKKHGLSYV